MNTNRLLMVDSSSNNGAPNLRRHFRAGFRLYAPKATEDTTYAWDQHGRLADRWHKLGGHCVHYHFARPGNPVEQAAHFIQTVKGHWRPGDLLALDVEVPGVDQAFIDAFIGHCHNVWPERPGVVYSYASFLNGVTPVHGWGLWLAAYGETQPEPTAGWNRLTFWQATDHAKVAGFPTRVDCSHILDHSLIPAVKEPPVKNAVKRYAKAHVALLGGVATWASVALQDGKVSTSEWEALATVVAAALGVALVPNKPKTETT